MSLTINSRRLGPQGRGFDLKGLIVLIIKAAALIYVFVLPFSSLMFESALNSEKRRVCGTCEQRYM